MRHASIDLQLLVDVVALAVVGYVDYRAADRERAVETLISDHTQEMHSLREVVEQLRSNGRQRA